MIETISADHLMIILWVYVVSYTIIDEVLISHERVRESILVRTSYPTESNIPQNILKSNLLGIGGNSNRLLEHLDITYYKSKAGGY